MANRRNHLASYWLQAVSFSMVIDFQQCIKQCPRTTRQNINAKLSIQKMAVKSHKSAMVQMKQGVITAIIAQVLKVYLQPVYYCTYQC